MSIVMLATDGEATRIVANRLAANFPLQAIVIEPREAVGKFFRRRLKRLGLLRVGGQVAFQLFSRALTFESRHRKAEILRRNAWRTQLPSGIPIHHVPSANDPACRVLLQTLRPQVMVVSGTRILSAKLLRSVDATFLNLHAGITPRYRGVHGAYWAFARRDAAHAGVTVHALDAGIDTGDVIAQRGISPENADNFATYPYLQLEAGLPLLEDAISLALAGRMAARATHGPSELFYHPTLWDYVWHRLVAGVK